MNIKINIKKNSRRSPSQHNYVDNDKFYAALVDYNNQVKHANINGLPKPKVSEYIGECLLQIAKNVATKGNFCSYTYKQDFEMDGVENSLRYIDNFDCERYRNPFSYFTMIVLYAFIRRIKVENKERYVKYKMFQDFMPDLEEENFVTYCKKNDYFLDEKKIQFLDKFEAKMKVKKKKKETDV